MYNLRKGSGKCLAALLILALLLSAGLTVSAADGFAYRHDPGENPKAMADIVADENAVYGFRPSGTGSLKQYADADWSDPALVARGRADRIAYHESLESMYDLLDDMRAEGRSVEEIARAVSDRRNEIRLEAYADDPEGLADLKARNLEKYGHEEGPLPDELFEKYGSWEVVMEKAFSTNAGMDACLGLYDDYYFMYVALGDVPADVTIELPASLDCGFKRSALLAPVIETDALEYDLRFETEDEGTVRVDNDGTVTGLRFGATNIRCIVTDASGCEHVSAPCRVRVRGNIALWFLHLIERIRNIFC